MRTTAVLVCGLGLGLGVSIGSGDALAGGSVPCALVCPADVIVVAGGGDAAVATYPQPVLEGIDCASEFPQGTTITCDPPSGSSFPIGETSVSCSTGEGLNGRSFTCGLTVTVLPPGCDVVAPDCDEGDSAECAEVVSPDCDAEEPIPPPER